MTDSAVSEEIIYQLAFDGNAWFAATNLGLKTSLDGGVSWNSAYASLKVSTSPIPTMALACTSQAGGRIVLAGLNEALLRSFEGGENWERLPLPSPAPVFTCLALSPDFAQDGRFYAGTMNDGVILFSQGGQKWSNWNFGLMDFNILCLGVAPVVSDQIEQILYAGVPTGVFRSLTGGRSWQELTLPCGFEPVVSLALSPLFQTDGTLFVGTESQGLFRSRDRGQSWQKIGQFDEPINALAFDGDCNTIVLHGSTLMISNDDGETWDDWEIDGLLDIPVSAFLPISGQGKSLIGYWGGAVQILAT